MHDIQTQRRILQICIAHHPDTCGGGSVETASVLAASLRARGASVHTVAPKHEAWRFRTSTWRSETTTRKGVTTTHVGHIWKSGYKFISPQFCICGWHLIKSADVVFIHGLRLFHGTVAAVYCVLTGTPFFLFPHGMIKRRWRAIGGKYIYDSVLGAALIHFAAAIPVFSQIEKEDALAEWKNARGKLVKLTMPIPSGSPPGEAPETITLPTKLEDGHGAVTIGVLCRIIPGKNIDALVGAIADAGLSRTCKVVVAGPEEDVNYKDRCLALAKMTDVSLSFVGPVQGDAREAFIEQLDVLAMVSEYESFGKTAVEALVRGVPVIVSSACGAAEEIRGIGVFIVEPTREDIAHTLFKITEGCGRILRQAKRELLEGRIVKLREQFDQATVTGQLLEILEKLT